MIALITNTQAKIISFIWDTDVTDAPLPLKLSINALRIAYLTIRDVFIDGQLNLRAMSLVYTTLLSIVPLLAVSVSFLKGFGVDSQLKTNLQNFLIPLGDRGKEISENIVTFVEGINSGLLGSLGIALLLYTVVSLMQKIESAFNFTWHVNEERSFARRFSDYLSMIIIGPVLVFSALGLTASVANSALYQAALSYSVFASIVGIFELFVPYLLIVLAFTLLYIFIPNTKVKFTSALIGAAITGLIWQSVGWLFASYVSTANYTAIYAAFAALFFFMIWVYISWLIMLTGGCIAFYYQNPEYRSRNRRRMGLSNRMKEKAALVAMTKIAETYYNKQAPLNLGQLANRLNIASESLSPMLENLIDCGLLIRTDADPAGFLPGQAPDSLPVVDILRAVRRTGEDDIIKIKRLPMNPGVDELYDRYSTAAMGAVSGVMLKDLVNVAETTETQRLTG